MKSISGLLVVLAGAALWSGPAWTQSTDEDSQAAVEAYLEIQTALEINRLCQGLKSVEHLALQDLVADRRDATGWYIANPDNETYWGVIDEHDAIARDRAAAMGCGEKAEALLGRFLPQALSDVFSDLLLAFHFASLPETDLYRIPLNPDEVAAAQRYDMYLQQRYGANFPTFSSTARNAVTAELQTAMDTGEPFNPFGSYLDDYSLYGVLDPSFGLYSQDNWEMMFLQGRARSVIDRVLLEVATEMGGHTLAERGHEGTSYIDLIASTTGGVAAKIWHGPINGYMQGYDGSFYLALTPQGGMRLVTWSQDAGALLGLTATVAVLVNTTPMPETFGSASDYYQDETWMEEAERFSATLATDCVGAGVCYEFAPADVARMLEISSTPLVEFVVSPEPDAGSTPRAESGYRYGQLDTSLLKALYADWVAPQ
ncbi:hypothetical protein [Pelagibacterium montanilacus]|uniref:hypothetical protein n=1 Tax=Pelagibacterium montanilacus TaxID=2185280 RepID=UPI000F8CF627|nr:hypothetical protein [Pelagibacterium montanilacus]